MYFLQNTSYLGCCETFLSIHTELTCSKFFKQKQLNFLETLRQVLFCVRMLTRLACPILSTGARQNHDSCIIALRWWNSVSAVWQSVCWSRRITVSELSTLLAPFSTKIILFDNEITDTNSHELIPGLIRPWFESPVRIQCRQNRYIVVTVVERWFFTEQC